MRQQRRLEAGPGTIGAYHPVLVRQPAKRGKVARGITPIAGWWWSADVPGPTQACMASCVRQGRDREHLSCAAIPRVTPGSYRRGRLLLWVLGVFDLPIVPAVFRDEFFLIAKFWTWVKFSVVSSLLASSPPGEAQSLSPFILVVRRFVACLRGFRWDPLWVPLFGIPLFLVLLEIFVVVAHAELSFCLPRNFLPLFGGLLEGSGILAIFLAFPSCGVPARWRGLRNVVFRHLRQVVFHLAGRLGVFPEFCSS